jgi:hypothetical protein
VKASTTLWRKLEISQEATCTERWEGSYARLEVVTYFVKALYQIWFLLVKRGSKDDFVMRELM